MQKTLIILTIAALSVTLAACGKKQQKTTPVIQEKIIVEEEAPTPQPTLKIDKSKLNEAPQGIENAGNETSANESPNQNAGQESTLPGTASTSSQAQTANPNLSLGLSDLNKLKSDINSIDPQNINGLAE